MRGAESANPLISVIVPVYNAGHSLERCLEHLLRSDYDNYEVLVIDDCSTDNSMEIATRFGCRILRQPSNRGAAAARNRGGREARGEILFFLDSDVFVKGDALALIAEDLVTKHRGSAVIGVYTKAQEHPGFYSQYQNLFTYFNHERSGDYISWFWTAMGAVTRTAFDETEGFNETYSGASAEDVELGYELSRRGHRIFYDSRIQGVHVHDHTLRSLLRGNLKKSAALVELIWRMSKQDKFAHGFSDRRNLYALMACAFMTLSAAATLVDFRLSLILLLAVIVFILANVPFYRLLWKEKGFLFLSKTLLLHYAVYLTVGLGSLLGTGRHLLAKGKSADPSLVD